MSLVVLGHAVRGRHDFYMLQRPMQTQKHDMIVIRWFRFLANGQGQHAYGGSGRMFRWPGNLQSVEPRRPWRTVTFQKRLPHWNLPYKKDYSMLVSVLGPLFMDPNGSMKGLRNPTM